MQNEDRAALEGAATDGEAPNYSFHTEPADQGGEQYVRCEACGAEVVPADPNIMDHRNGCPVGEPAPTPLSADTVVRAADVTVAVTDGRLKMSERVTAGLHVETPDHRPAIEAEPHLSLRVATPAVRVTIDLGKHGRNVLAQALGGGMHR